MSEKPTKEAAIAASHLVLQEFDNDFKLALFEAGRRGLNTAEIARSIKPILDMIYPRLRLRVEKAIVESGNIGVRAVVINPARLKSLEKARAANASNSKRPIRETLERLLTENGWSPKRVADKLQVKSSNTVRNWMRDYQLVRPWENPERIPSQSQLTKALEDTRYVFTETAKVLGVRPQDIKRWAEEYKIKKPWEVGSEDHQGAINVADAPQANSAPSWETLTEEPEDATDTLEVLSDTHENEPEQGF